jgi:SAM-dependent methyltransferase
VAAAPGTAFFATPDAAAGAAELRDVQRWLAAAGLPAAGRLLDVGGGPGFVAAGLAPAAAVTLLEHSPTAAAHARALGVDAHPYDFRGAPISRVASGPFDLVMLRYSVAWCADLPAFAAQLTPVTRPGAALLLTFVLPTRGACLGTALEDAAPAVLWTEAALLAGFARAGWRPVHRFAPAPPLPFAAPHGRAFAAASWPWAVAPGPLPYEFRQLHAGLVLRRAA